MELPRHLFFARANYENRKLPRQLPRRITRVRTACKHECILCLVYCIQLLQLRSISKIWVIFSSDAVLKYPKSIKPTFSSLYSMKNEPYVGENGKIKLSPLTTPTFFTSTQTNLVSYLSFLQISTMTKK